MGSYLIVYDEGASIQTHEFEAESWTAACAHVDKLFSYAYAHPLGEDEERPEDALYSEYELSWVKLYQVTNKTRADVGAIEKSNKRQELEHGKKLADKKEREEYERLKAKFDSKQTP